MTERGRRAGRAGVTIRDVARQSGVSVMTVSRVIHREPVVGEETRARVKRTIAELGYRPNTAARLLAGGRAMRLHLIHDDATRPHLTGILLACLDQAVSAGIELCVASMSSGLSQELSRTQAVILAPPLGDDAKLIETLAGKPMVVAAIGTPQVRRRGIIYLETDWVASARAMTDHLLALGHRDIGLLLPREPDHIARLCGEGYDAAHRALSLAPTEALIQRIDRSYRVVGDVAWSLLESSVRPTAIIAADAEMAAAALAAAQAAGRDVPADVTICALDDAPIAEMVWPQITVARRPIEALTRLAVDLVVERLQSPSGNWDDDAVVRTLPFEMTRRQSDASPRRRPQETTSKR